MNTEATMTVPRNELTQVLLADDDEAVRVAMARALVRAGYHVRTAENGEAALQVLWTHPVDVVVSDIDMPLMDGMQLLRAIRQRDSALPVVLITGKPASTDSAIEALESGVAQYLTKPFGPEELASAVDQAMERKSLGPISRELMELSGAFERTLSTLHMHYQPLVRLSDRSVVGWECLMRSGEPALPHPGAVLDAAERLERLDDLGRCVRRLCVSPVRRLSPDALLFVNLHVRDLLDPQLYDAGAPLAWLAPRVILEITERARLTDVPDVSRRVARLRDMGFRIAVDDIGAGYAGLTSFADLEPDVLKIDMSLVRDIDQSRTKQRIVQALVQVCDELDHRMLVAEGVETSGELSALAELGCDVFQGYLFARPAAGLPEPDWSALDGDF